jgi:glycosyltransferase involved in cell wall biosynthesis
MRGHSKVRIIFKWSTRAMKLAIFLRAPEVWGAERSLLTLLESEPAKQHDIHVFIAPGSPLGQELERLNVVWSTFDFLRHRSVAAGGLRHASPASVASDLVGIAVSGFKARRLVSKYDAVLTFGLWETPEIALAGKFSNTPVIFDFHVTFGGKAGQLALKNIMRLVQGVVAPAEATYTQAGILHRSDKQTVIARPIQIPPAADDGRLAIWPRKLRVGIFGQVDERKNVLEVVHTLTPLRDHVELSVIGLRPENSRTEYEHLVISEVGLVGAGWNVQPRSNSIGNLMAGCDVVLNMSRHEAFGRTVVESACVGAHPVVIGGGGPAEIVRQMGVGTVVDSWDDLRLVLWRFSQEVAAGGSVRVASHLVESIRSQYSPSTVAEKYFRNVARLASGRSQRMR